MTKTFKNKKEEHFLTKNHNGGIKYRIRIQEDEESEQEVQEYLKEHNAEEQIQDTIRRTDFQG